MLFNFLTNNMFLEEKKQSDRVTIDSPLWILSISKSEWIDFHFIICDVYRHKPQMYSRCRFIYFLFSRPSKNKYNFRLTRWAFGLFKRDCTWVRTTIEFIKKVNKKLTYRTLCPCFCGLVFPFDNLRLIFYSLFSILISHTPSSSMHLYIP